MKRRSLHDLLHQARGTNNLSDFARLCNCSPASMYNWAKGKIKRLPKPTTIELILANAAPESDITRDELMLAFEDAIIENGGLLINNNETVCYKPIPQYESELESDFGGIIVQKLLGKGLKIESTSRQIPFSFDLGYTVESDTERQTIFFEILPIKLLPSTVEAFEKRIYHLVGRWIFEKNKYPDNTWLYIVISVEDNAIDQLIASAFTEKIDENISLILQKGKRGKLVEFPLGPSKNTFVDLR